MIIATLSTGAQTPSDSESTDAPSRERVMRFQDSLDSREDWDIGMPAIESDLSFAALIRDGRALNSETYLALDSEFRKVMQMLRARPDDELTRRRLEDLQNALMERIQINLRFDYLYAATVYIELLRRTGAPPGVVRQFSRRLRERRSDQAR